MTEARLAAEETRQKTELLQVTLDHIDQGLSVIEAGGDQILANRRYCDLLGLPASYMNRRVPLQEIVRLLEDRGELEDMSDELRDQLDRWEAGQTSSDSIVYERRQANGKWLLVACRRLPGGGHVRTFTDITERKQAEQQAYARRELLEFTLQNIDQGVIIRDAEDNILLFNERLSTLLDVPVRLYENNSSTETLNQYHAQQKIELAEGDEDRIYDWMRRRQQGQPVERLEYQRRGEGGRWLHVVFQALPDGREIRTFSDIANIKAVERDLRDKTRFLEAVLGAMEQGVLVSDTQGKLSLWNDRAASILDIDPGTLGIGLDVGELRAAQQAAGDLDPSDPEMAAYTQAWLDWRDKAPAGEIFSRERSQPGDRWMLVSGRKLPDGEIVRTLTDITAWKRNERETNQAKEEAELARERLRAAMDAMPAGVVILDEALNYQAWNETYRTLAQFSDEDLTRLGSIDRVAEAKRLDVLARGDMDFDSYVAKRRQLYERRAPSVTTEYWASVDRHIELRINPIPNGGWVSVYLDMTSRIEAERELAAARDLAEEATQAKSAFLAAMSHEIRTPMNGVIGMAEILQQTALDDDQRSIVGTIRDSGQALLRIIDDILDFSKIEAGKLELEAEPVAVRGLVEAVLDTLGPAAERKDLDLAARIADAVPEVVVSDPVRLRQTLLNLVGNAVKFTERGAVTVRVDARLEPAQTPRAVLRVEVVDTGIGIAPERIGNLFQPFRQAETSTTREFGGTGLGLSICERLVSLMGGTLGVDSTRGEGSRFWFEIPVPIGTGTATRQDDYGLAGVAVLLAVRPGPTGDAMADILRRRGLLVTEATAELIAADGRQFDVVVADGRLGAAVAGLAPALARSQSQANARQVWVCHGRESAAHAACVTRPVRREALLKAVAAVLGRASPDLPSMVATAAPGIPSPATGTVAADAPLILVAEDNPTNRTVVQRQLSILGFAVEAAEDGAQALAMWRSGRYDLVLTDCHMPNMDGYQLARSIRDAEQPGGVRTPIVALTANALAGEAERCLEAGMDDYLTKPVTLDAIGRTLGRWLDRPVEVEAGSSPTVEAAGPLPPVTSAAPPIDYDMLGQILGNTEPDFVRSMLSLFRESYTSLKARMSAAIGARDAAALRAAAHAAKGAAGNACATRLRAVLDSLESGAAAGDWSAVSGHWDELTAEDRVVLEHISSL